jgi:hypothetical protein
MARTLLTIEETGRALGVSVATVWRRIRTGQIESVRSAGRRLVPRRVLSKAAATKGRGAIPEFTADHPIFDLVGCARSGGTAPGARDKHKVLGE